jgi:PAS domain S-box-containing protein
VIAEAAALALSERRYRSLLEAVPVQAVWVANPAGEKLDDSPGFRRLTGLTLEEYRGLGWLNALHPDDRGPTERKWSAALRTKRIYEAEYRIRLATGEYRWFAAYGVPVIENGEVVEWVGTFTDIHSQKLLREG